MLHFLSHTNSGCILNCAVINLAKKVIKLYDSSTLLSCCSFLMLFNIKITIIITDYLTTIAKTNMELEIFKSTTGMDYIC